MGVGSASRVQTSRLIIARNSHPFFEWLDKAAGQRRGKVLSSINRGEKMIQASVEEGSTAGPFTFAAVWHVKRECVVQFEALLQQMIAAAAVFPGHEGVHAVTPAASSAPVYRVVVRFASEKNFYTGSSLRSART